jgi:hypothetical protein
MPNRRDEIIQLAALQRLPRAKLRTLWTKELSETPPSSLGRDILALGIAYARQERLYGVLSRRVVKELERLGACALSNGAEAELSTNPIPRAGTILVREWQGVIHHVTVTDDGFLWNGNSHRSLSGIARAITGTAWNGPRFFGLRGGKTKSSGAEHE